LKTISYSRFLSLWSIEILFYLCSLHTKMKKFYLLITQKKNTKIAQKLTLNKYMSGHENLHLMNTWVTRVRSRFEYFDILQQIDLAFRPSELDISSP